MGEHEQGGMLRNVVVLGLVTLIAVISIAFVLNLKGNIRHNNLKAMSLGTNVLDFNTKRDVNGFTRLLDHGVGTTVTATKDNVFTVTLDPATNFPQGIYYTNTSVNNTSNYEAFLEGDSYRMRADIRVVAGDPAGVSVYRIGMEGANNDYDAKPAFSQNWQTYESHGNRGTVWGEAVLYFVNKSPKPVTLEIKEINLYR